MGHEARQTNFIQICSQARSARLQPPPTLTAPLPAAAPDNPSTCDPTRTNTDLSQYPTAAVIRRPLNRWRPPPNFQALSPTDQLLDWFEFHANQLAPPTDLFFFPRVRTPCGHGAQVIIEGREIQSDGGEEDKDNNPTDNKKPKQTTAQRPSLHHPVVFPLY